MQFGYGLNDLIDTEHAVIVDVGATPARTYDEAASTKVMIARTDRRFAIKPKLPAAGHALRPVAAPLARPPARARL